MWHLIQNLLPLFPFLGMLWSPCCCSTGTPCTICTVGATPQTIQVVTSGTTDGDCTNCSTTDGTYILSGPVEPAISSANGCDWNLSISVTACNALGIGTTTDYIVINISSSTHATVGFGQGAGLNFPEYGWTGSSTGTGNCKTAAETTYSAAGNGHCVMGTVTVTVLT